MRRWPIAFALVAMISAQALAQSNPQVRQGFWISFGFGYGSLGCEHCDNRVSGTSGYLRMGGTLSQRLLIGGEINGWSKTEGNTTLTVSNVGPVVYFYPDAHGGFYLKGGVALASAKLDIGRFTGDETGSGVILGLGWDARVGRNFALTPYFDLLTSNFDGGSLNTYAFGLGFTWP